MQGSARTKFWDYVVDLILFHICFLSYWSKPQNIKKENHDQSYLSAGQMCEALRAQSCGTAPGPSRPFQLAFCGSFLGQPLPNTHTHTLTQIQIQTHTHTRIHKYRCKHTTTRTKTRLHTPNHTHTYTHKRVCTLDEWIYSLHLDPPMTHQPFFEEHKQPQQWWPSNYSMPPPYHCMPLQYQSMKKHEGSRAKQVVQSHSQHPLL